MGLGAGGSDVVLLCAGVWRLIAKNEGYSRTLASGCLCLLLHYSIL